MSYNDYNIAEIKNDIFQLYLNIGFNLFIITLTESMYIYASIKGTLIIYQDWKVYKNIYQKLVHNEKMQLKKLNSIIQTIQTKPCVQNTDNLDKLYDIGYMINIDIQKLLYSIAIKTCGILIPTILKSPRRCIEKTCRRYNRNASRLCDIIRSSIIFCNTFGCKGECAICSDLLGSNDSHNKVIIDIKKKFDNCNSFEKSDSDVSSIASSIDIEDIHEFDTSNFNINNLRTIDRLSSEQSTSVSYISSSNNTQRKVNFDPKNKMSFRDHIKNINTYFHYDHNCLENDSQFLCENFMLFINEFKENEYIEIVNISNLYNDKNKLGESIGYRDITIEYKIQYRLIAENKIKLLTKNERNKRNNYFICELQLHSIEMYKHKSRNAYLNNKKYRNILSV